MDIDDKKNQIFRRIVKVGRKTDLWQEYYKLNNIIAPIKRLLSFHYRYLRYLLIRIIHGEHVINSVLGVNIKYSSPENSYWALFGMIPENAEIRLSLFLVKNLKKSDIFFDIGAHLGFYTILASVFINKGSVYSFEPTPTIYALLHKNTHSISNVHINQIAVSDVVGNATFYLNDNDSVTNTLFKPRNFTSSIKVNTETLNNFCSVNNVYPNLIKIDAEGSEMNIIDGASAIIRDHQPIICMELYESKVYPYKNVFNKLISYGYSVYSIDDLGNTELLSSSYSSIDNFLLERRRFFDNFVFKK